MESDYEVIVDKGGVQFLTYKGEVLPAQMKTVVVQGIEHVSHSGTSRAEVTVTVLALLKPTK